MTITYIFLNIYHGNATFTMVEWWYYIVLWYLKYTMGHIQFCLVSVCCHCHAFLCSMFPPRPVTMDTNDHQLFIFWVNLSLFKLFPVMHSLSGHSNAYVFVLPPVSHCWSLTLNVWNLSSAFICLPASIRYTMALKFMHLNGFKVLPKNTMIPL